MSKIPNLTDEQISFALQSTGLNQVLDIQQELMEGLRSGNPNGYRAFRRLLEKLDNALQQSKPSSP